MTVGNDSNACSHVNGGVDGQNYVSQYSSLIRGVFFSVANVDGYCRPSPPHSTPIYIKIALRLEVVGLGTCDAPSQLNQTHGEESFCVKHLQANWQQGAPQTFSVILTTFSYL